MAEVKTETVRNEDYVPGRAVIKDIRNETPDTKTYSFSFLDEKRFDFSPGQFVKLSLMGVGEIPISIPMNCERDGLELTIRRVGEVTDVIHNLKPGAELGIRGPYGNTFPIAEQKGKDLLFVAGGCGLAPLRSVIQYVLDHREEYGRVNILYGARTPADLIYKEEYSLWESEEDVSVHLIVDNGDENWDGKVGVVPSLLSELDLNPGNTAAFICGPSIMIYYTVESLIEMNLNREDIFVTLEAHMKCGVGKCLHCYLGNGLYVCIDGPVFSFEQLRDIPHWEEKISHLCVD